jgi:GNAT superfamily N-acetyltransferase
MNTLHLRPMTHAEFEIYFAQFRVQLFNDSKKTGLVSAELAKKHVDQDLIENIPDGFETKNNYWLTIANEDAKNLGSIWYALKGEGEKQTAYLGDIVVAPDFRRMGVGKQALALFEAEIKSSGIKNNIAVHIIGDFNEAAIKLFKLSGYFTSDIMMEKTIHS